MLNERLFSVQRCRLLLSLGFALAFGWRSAFSAAIKAPILTTASAAEGLLLTA
jgi:hypothetical protein